MQQPQQIHINPELKQKYNVAKATYQQVVKAVLAIEEEKKEHLWNKKPCHQTNQRFGSRPEML